MNERNQVAIACAGVKAFGRTLSAGVSVRNARYLNQKKKKSGERERVRQPFGKKAAIAIE